MITLTSLALYIVMPALLVSITLGFIRLVRGPSLPDRIVALDFMTTLGLGVGATYSLATQQTIYIDVAIVLALISFLGTVAFARYVERSI